MCKGGTCKLSGFGFVQDITDRNLYETVNIFFNRFHLYPLGLPHLFIFEPRHEISNNVVCATSKASDQPAHMHSLIRAFASPLSIL